MVQILPQAPSLGELLGGGMGQGMQQGFEQMRQGSALSQMLGLGPEEAQALGRMPAQMQQVLGAALIKHKMQEAETSNILNLVQKYKAQKGTGGQGYGGQPVSPNQPMQPGQMGQPQPTQPGQTGQPQPTQPASDKFVPPNDQDLIDVLSSSSNKAYQNRAKTMIEENKAAAKQDQFSRQEARKQKEYELKVQKFGFEKEKVLTERAFAENKPYVENVNKKRSELADRQSTLLSIRDVIIKSGGDLGKTRNWLASIMPGDSEFIKKSSANELASFVKDLFVSDLKGLPGGSKLNQLIERNLLSALQSPGKSLESNQKITEFQQHLLDINQKEIKLFDEIRDQYLKEGKEPPRGLQSIVHKKLAPYIKQRQQELLKTYKDIDSGKLKSPQMLNMPFAKFQIEDQPPKPGFVWILSPEGKPVQAPINEIEKWLDGGGELIK